MGQYFWTIYNWQIQSKHIHTTGIGYGAFYYRALLFSLLNPFWSPRRVVRIAKLFINTKVKECQSGSKQCTKKWFMWPSRQRWTVPNPHRHPPPPTKKKAPNQKEKRKENTRGKKFPPHTPLIFFGLKATLHKAHLHRIDMSNQSIAQANH